MPDITGVFLRWAGLRAGLHEGYWLVASLYLVVDARLSAWELVFLGTMLLPWEPGPALRQGRGGSGDGE